MIIKAFFGREDRIGEINRDTQRVQYDSFKKDEKRIGDASDAVVDFIEELNEKTEEYLSQLDEWFSNPSQDTSDTLKTSRAELVEAWALAQVALSKFAWVMRMDGNEAFHRTLDHLKTGNTLSMEAL